MHSWEGTYWLVNSKATGGDFVTLWGITGAPAAPVMTGYNIPVLSYATVPDCIQPNGQLVEMGTTRLGNAVYESGELWTVHSKHVDVGPPSGIGGVNLHAINTATQSLNVSYYTAFLDTAGNYLYAGYPSVDFDTSGRGIVCVLLGGPTVYLSMGYSGFTAAGGFSWGYYPAVYGEANYAHTGSPPWAWGMTTAVARDPADDVTLWMAGAYASSAPTPSWDTRIVATTQELPGLLSVTPSAPVVSTGLEGGPFTPPEAVYVIEHNGVGSAGLAWTLTGFDFTWNTPDRTAGFVTAGQRDTVRLTIHAESLPPGTYADGYTFDDCFSNQTHSRSTVLTVGADGSCPGAVLDLLPTGAPNTLPVSNEERGVYITAMKDIDVCALGMAADLQVPQGVTVRIYEAKGSARGALLASGTHTATQSGDVMHYVPITYTLNACQEYDITFEFGVANNIRWWAEGLVAEPYDVAGAIRVRDGELAGDAANFALLNFSLLGTPTSCDQTTDLTPPGASWSSCTDTTTERGVFVTANQTMNICALSWYASFGGTPADVTAKIYEATGTTRGALIATGSTTDSGPPGMSARTIPISCQLRKGMDYDFVVEFPASWWACIVESDITLPYTVGDAITVLDGEQAGNANSAIITHFAVDWTPGTAGAPFHLAKPDVYPPPLSLTAADLRYGMFVTALAGEELYSLGWRADIPEGAVISARVYEAAGTTRGVLVSEGTILSSGPGTQWHDVPVSASLNAGSDYDFEIDFTQVNMWRYWTDGSGMPYQPYGVIEVVNSEQGGNAANSILIDMRMNACNAVATGITGSEPVRPPGFSMSFHPNPTSARSTLGFSLDTPGPVTITVYDVTGRKVATLLQNETRPAGPGTVYFDSRSVAAGVYFVKMQTPTKSLSRKLTVVH
ncbi:MAG: T9SS type A sorting domain-containing protein [Candidatus Krumholzibacteriia bacterium]